VQRRKPLLSTWEKTEEGSAYYREKGNTFQNGTTALVTEKSRKNEISSSLSGKEEKGGRKCEQGNREQGAP